MFIPSNSELLIHSHLAVFPGDTLNPKGPGRTCRNLESLLRQEIDRHGAHPTIGAGDQDGFALVEARVLDSAGTAPHWQVGTTHQQVDKNSRKI